MVKEIRVLDETLYVCERCGLRYREKIWAERCEDFCSRHNACSIEIVKHAVKNKEMRESSFSVK